MQAHEELTRVYVGKMTAKIETVQAAQKLRLIVKNEHVGRIQKKQQQADDHSLPTKQRLNQSPSGMQQSINGPRTGPVIIKSEVVPFDHNVITRQSLFQRSVTAEEMTVFAKYCVGRDISEGRYSATQFVEGNSDAGRESVGLPFNFAEQHEAIEWVQFVRKGNHALPELFVGCLDRLWLNWCGKGDKDFLNKVGIAVVSSKDKRVQSGSAIGFYRAVGISLISCDQVHRLLSEPKGKKYFFG